MTYKQFCDIIFKLYLYSDLTKKIHYSTNSNHCHELADKIRETIIEYTDNIAEMYFGFYGKPKYSDLTLQLDIIETDDLTKICQNVINIIEPIRTDCNKNNSLSGIASVIDDFKSKLAQYSFLGTFDKVSNQTLKK